MIRVLSGERHERECVGWLTGRIADYTRREVGRDALLVDCGLDSVARLSLYGDIEAEFGPGVGPADLWMYPTVRELARHLAARRAGEDGGQRVRAVFVFGGQGSQYPGMARGLYRHSTCYRSSLTWVDEVLWPYLGRSVTDLVLGQDPGIDRTALSQPALFAVEYALARTLLDAGVRPVAVLGHGIGEFAAATVAEALTLGHAARLVALRAACMQRLPGSGGMLATCADPYEAAEVAAVEPGVSIGAVNAARATVLSGDLEGLARVRTRLADAGISSRLLPVDHAFHSPFMAAAVPPFTAAARRSPGARPQLPFYSTVYGRQLTDPLGTSYWAHHMTAPVRFADAARHMLAHHAPTHIIEIAPRPILTPLLRRLAGPTGPHCLSISHDTDTLPLAGVLAALDAGEPGVGE
ncbi:acyltransferase domain-containing protein [Streptomyces roseirectus]|uniref:Acyltransferase domain-containing protein n=1 Tax=Streptomyces roseirectus TaxID=2768066 RepID=A0A7H0IA49_9ACTN|nr:acyltransferase domain-containing protein [Streptomyces roseirectus]QNP69665.1 acyltransferase domain-containing protein [Streptomyces roseirectus]